MHGMLRVGVIGMLLATACTSERPAPEGPAPEPSASRQSAAGVTLAVPTNFLRSGPLLASAFHAAFGLQPPLRASLNRELPDETYVYSPSGLIATQDLVHLDLGSVGRGCPSCRLRWTGHSRVSEVGRRARSAHDGIHRSCLAAMDSVDLRNGRYARICSILRPCSCRPGTHSKAVWSSTSTCSNLRSLWRHGHGRWSVSNRRRTIELRGRFRPRLAALPSSSAIPAGSLEMFASSVRARHSCRTRRWTACLPASLPRGRR